MSDAFIEAFTSKGGALLNTISVQQGEKDFSYLLRSFPAEFDLLFYGGTFEGAPLLNALRSGGFDQLMATGDGCWDKLNFLDPAADSLEKGEGVVVLSASSDVGDIPGSEKFAAAYSKAYGVIINYALNCYDCANILLRAIADAVETSQNTLPDRNAVSKALQHLRLKGIANDNYTVWDEKGDNKNAITRLYRARKGRFEAI